MRITLQQLGVQLRQRSVSPVELTRECLARIENLNPKLNAFISILADSAMSAARNAEEEIQRGNNRGSLHGIPLGIKDIFDTAGTRTTAASALFKDRIPDVDAEVVRRVRDAGAIVLGKQNLHEFAYGGSSIVSFFGEVHNPWDTTRIAGGSSGGSAASVAAGLGYASIGTDTAGSVRLPAAYCGVVGLKPTFGRVSARGVIPLSRSLDHVGLLTNSVSDSAIMLQAIAGYDAGDPASANLPVQDYVRCLDRPLGKLRVGVPRAFFFEGLHAEVAAAVEQAIAEIKAMGLEIRDVKLDIPLDRTLSSAESFAYHESWVASSPELYQLATLERIRSGAKTTAEEVRKAQVALAAERESIGEAFKDFDVLLTPTVPIPPPMIAELQSHPENLRPVELMMLRNTRPFNVWGIPAISVPCGFTTSGMPIGLQLAAAPWNECLLLQVAYAYEQATMGRAREIALS